METQGRLIVDIARLDRGGEWFEGETAPDVLELGGSEFVKPVGGIEYALKVERIGTELLARGALRQRLRYVCSRCARDFEAAVAEKDFICTVEINETSSFVDLTGEIREAIILGLSAYPVCDAACKGLCAACGANLNVEECACRKEGTDNCWAALDALK